MSGTWIGNCVACHREGVHVTSRPTHGERVLCDGCAAKPYRMPSATGLVDRSRPKASGGPSRAMNAAAPDRYVGRRLSVAALLDEPDRPIPWRCDRFAADGYLTVLAGRGGEGKSWLALALAVGVSAGKPRAGLACRRGRALIFDAENGRDLMRRRLRAAGVADGIGLVLVDGLDIVKDADWFTTVICEERANLVVFDSLRMLTSGRDEDKSGDMERPVSTLRRIARSTEAAVVLVHHRGKGAADFRGSSVIADQCDMLFALGREADDPERRTRRKLHTAKCRIDEEPAVRWLAINADPDRGIVTVDRAEPYEPEGSGRPARDGLRNQVLGLLTGISQSATRIAKAVGRHPKDGTVRRLLRDLEGEGLVERRDDGWAVPSTASRGDGTRGTPLETSARTVDLDGATPSSSGGTYDVRNAGGCRCDAPLPAPSEGILRCTRCGRSVEGWSR